MRTLPGWFKGKQDLGILILRLFIGLRLVYGVVDNVVSWPRMVEFSEFLQSQGFPLSTLSAITSVYVQFIGGLLVLLGYQIRVAAVFLILNFLVALFMVHQNDTVEAMTPALAMLFGNLTFLFTGAGKLSVDRQ